jgi:hypothetical protein
MASVHISHMIAMIAFSLCFATSDSKRTEVAIQALTDFGIPRQGIVTLTKPDRGKSSEWDLPNQQTQVVCSHVKKARSRSIR